LFRLDFIVPLFSGRIRRLWVASANGTMSAHRIRATSLAILINTNDSKFVPKLGGLRPVAAPLPPHAWSNPAPQDYQACRRHRATQMNIGRDR
jgi:hypothetical protein